MIHINSMSDLDAIREDPDLWREAYGFLSVCAYEILKYCDDEDLVDHDFNMFILDDSERSHIDDFGTPEETARSKIECCGEIRMFRRLVYVSQIVLYEESPK